MKSILFPAMFFITGIVLFYKAYGLIEHAASVNNNAGLATVGFCIAGGMALIAAALAIRKQTERD